MPIKKSSQFNRAVTAFLDDAAGSNTYQLLMVQLVGVGTKAITGIQASGIRQNNFGGAAATVQDELAHEFQQIRVAVLAGRVEWDSFNPSQLLLGFSVANADIFQNTPNVVVPPVLFDTSFINQLTVNFNPPLRIEEGIDVSIVMSSPLCPTDPAQDTIDVKIGYLTVLGGYETNGQMKFPYTLR